MKLKDKYPNEVDVIENSDRSICAHIPNKWVKVSHPRQVSDEQKEAARERFANIRNTKQ